MKNFLYLFVAAALLTACNNSDVTGSKDPKFDSLAQAAAKDSANYTTIQWLDPVDQDLGKITEGASVDLMWKFKNTGNKPLLIASAVGTCGCTNVEHPNQPIPPGGEGIIKARFNSEGKEGQQHKQVVVLANNSNKNGDREDDLKFTVLVEAKK